MMEHRKMYSPDVRNYCIFGERFFFHLSAWKFGIHVVLYTSEWSMGWNVQRVDSQYA